MFIINFISPIGSQHKKHKSYSTATQTKSINQPINISIYLTKTYKVTISEIYVVSEYHNNN